MQHAWKCKIPLSENVKGRDYFEDTEDSQMKGSIKTDLKGTDCEVVG